MPKACPPLALAYSTRPCSVNWEETNSFPPSSPAECHFPSPIPASPRPQLPGPSAPHLTPILLILLSLKCVYDSSEEADGRVDWKRLDLSLCGLLAAV